jgi:hypothetical protein
MIVLTLLTTFAFVPGKGQTHVQTNWKFQTNNNVTITQSFTGASTNGHLVVVHLDWTNQSVHIASVTDSKGNAYKKINGTTNWNGTAYAAELWYAYNITGAATLTITATLSGNPTATPAAGSFSQIYISEYSGIATSVDPLDVNSVTASNSATPSSGAVVTRYTHELVYGASIGASGTLNAGAGFSGRSTQNNNIIEDKNVATSNSYAATFSSGGGNWVAQMATFISTISVLPVDFEAFTGACSANGHVQLNWTTASEENNDFFTVQQSNDAADWQDVGTVKAVGNSSAEQTYAYTATAIGPSVAYYRIKQTDLDGRSTYSSIVGVNSCTLAVAAPQICPNPVVGSVLTGQIATKERYVVEVVDNIGRIIYRGSFQQPEFRISLPNGVLPGVYYARIGLATTTTVTPFLVR